MPKDKIEPLNEEPIIEFLRHRTKKILPRREQSILNTMRKWHRNGDLDMNDPKNFLLGLQAFENSCQPSHGPSSSAPDLRQIRGQTVRGHGLFNGPGGPS